VPLRRLPPIAITILCLAGASFGACRRSPSSKTGAAGTGGPGGGSAGQSGSGGTGQVGSGGAGGTATASGWLDDASVWTAVPGGDDCGLFAADVTRPGGPAARGWSACGTGCRESPAATLPTDTGVYRYALAAGAVGNSVFLRTTSGNPAYRLMLVTDLGAGTNVAAVKQTKNFSSCAPIASGHALRALPFLLPGNVALVGVAVLAARAVTWSKPQTGLPVITNVFANDAGWAMQFDDGSIRTLMPATAASLTTIDRGVAPTGQGQAVLDRMVWSSAEANRDPEVVKTFTPADGVKTIAAQDTDDHAVALSDTKVVWIGTTGPERHQGTYQSAQLSWAAWPDAGSSVQIHAGPSLAATNALSSLATWGDFAATIGCGQSIETCQLLVVQLSTNRIWQIHRRPTGVFLDVLAVSSTEIVLTERGYPTGYNDQVEHLVRLDLSQLDALEHAW
jgi:hypothetical protein